jgi:hypothetical protein
MEPYWKGIGTCLLAHDFGVIINSMKRLYSAFSRNTAGSRNQMKNEPNKSMEPMRLLVTPAASHLSRQATAWLIMTLAKKTISKHNS